MQYSMRRLYIRSIIFNVLFVLLSAILSVLYIPFLILPHKGFVYLIRFYLWCTYVLERFILGLRYEIRGREHLPDHPPYIVGAKHQSTYETLKLHLIFDDPAIILKRELLKIPLWGLYLKKSVPIAIDRTNPDSAIQSIQDGAKRVKNNHRPIVIFPQGTRVKPSDTAQNKPYKVGIARIQEATDLPIIPMATNTGVFWPRDSFLKSGGTVIFEFLPPIPQGLERSDLLARLEQTIEPASNALMAEAVAENKASHKNDLWRIVWGVVLGFLIYTALWFATAHIIKTHYGRTDYLPETIERYTSNMRINGFPGFINISTPSERIQTPRGYTDIQNLRFHIPPLPFSFIRTRISADQITVFDRNWPEPLKFQNAHAHISGWGRRLTVHDVNGFSGKTYISAQGVLDYKTNTPPHIDMTATLINHEALIATLVDQSLINKNEAIFAALGLNLYRQPNGLIVLPITQTGGTIYIGALPVYRFAKTNMSINRQPRSKRLPGRGTPVSPAP